jgi:hypothetical protein
MTIFERIMKIRRPVVFRHESGLYGSCYPTSRQTPIVINLCFHKRGNPVKTYIHECIHILYPPPLLSERDVRRVEKHVWNKLTAKQHFLIARKLYNRKWRVR